jgi:hypothetical protein
MNKRVVLLILVVSLSLSTLGQNKKIDLKITDFEYTCQNLNFNLTVTNVSDTIINTYLPTVESIRYGLLKIRVINSKTNQIYTFSPNKVIVVSSDLDHVTLDSLNTLSLNPQEQYKQPFNIPKKQIYSGLKKSGNYQLYIAWYFEGVEFRSSFENVFNGNVESNRVNLNLYCRRE